MFGQIEKKIPEVKIKLDELKSKGPNKKYDLYQDEILMDQAIIFIKEDPKKYIKLYFKKFLSFLFIDLNSSYNNYYSPLHLIPKIILSITSLIGMILAFKLSLSRKNYIILFYIANIGLFSFFFILPRYSLSLLTIQIILSLFVLKKIKPNL